MLKIHRNQTVEVRTQCSVQVFGGIREHMINKCDNSNVPLSEQMKKAGLFEECIQKLDPDIEGKRSALQNQTVVELDAMIDKTIACIETALQ